MDTKSIKDRLSAIFTQLQQLQIQASKQNTEIILGSLNALSSIYDDITELEEAKNKPAEGR